MFHPGPGPDPYSISHWISAKKALVGGSKWKKIGHIIGPTMLKKKRINRYFA